MSLWPPWNPGKVKQNVTAGLLPLVSAQNIEIIQIVHFDKVLNVITEFCTYNLIMYCILLYVDSVVEHNKFSTVQPLNSKRTSSNNVSIYFTLL